jgi:uncharacterized protein DUF5658
MQRGELGASLKRGAAVPSVRASVTREDAALVDTALRDPVIEDAVLDPAVLEVTVLEDTADVMADVMARRRRAVILGLAVLAVLQAADVLATWALLANDGAELNPVGRALIGSGGAIVVKFAIIGALLALVLSRPVVRMGFVCGVWAVTGIYLAVVAMNLYSLHLVGGLG